MNRTKRKKTKIEALIKIRLVIWRFAMIEKRKGARFSRLNDAGERAYHRAQTMVLVGRAAKHQNIKTKASRKIVDFQRKTRL